MYCDKIPSHSIDILREIVLDMLKQIPAGMVTTYGDIASALGDIRASRAIGKVVSENPFPVIVPCHRVVYSNGEIGWYGGYGKGTEEKKELLMKEGVQIENNKVKDFERIRFRAFTAPPILKLLLEKQLKMKSLVIENDVFESARYVAGIDVSYEGNKGYAAIAVLDMDAGEFVEERVVVKDARFPYIPSYLGFREIPVIADLITFKPHTIYLIDGHGVLHPRGFGIASHIGVEFDVPTIGIAKELLVGTIQDKNSEISAVILDNKIRGYRVQIEKWGTRIISAGHKISLESALDIYIKCLRQHSTDPLRKAHRIANNARKSSEHQRRDAL
ncbi:MAG: endonuclease V [Methanomassiliicoccales archaeon]